MTEFPKKEKLVFDKKPAFEEVYDIIIQEINKKSHKWRYQISYMDFNDVRSKIIIHIFKKWDKYDHTKPLHNWINKIISNQMFNIARDNYTIHLSPCSSCACNLGSQKCEIYGKTESPDCPLYEKWEKEKQSSFNINVPVSMENHSNEVNSKLCTNLDFDGLLNEVKEKAKIVLTKKEYILFDLLYLQKVNEKIITKKLHSKNQTLLAYNKQIELLKKSILIKIKKIIFED